MAEPPATPQSDPNGISVSMFRKVAVTSGTFSMVASRLLAELDQERGTGPWRDQLRAELEREVKRAVMEGFTPEEEFEMYDASLGVIRSLFGGS